MSVVSIWWCCFTLCSWIVVNDLSELFPPVVLNCCCCRCIWYWIIWPHSPLTGCVVWCMLLMSLLFLFVLCVVGFQCCAWCRPAHLGPLSTCCVVWEWWCCFNCCCVVDLNIWVLSQLLCCILFILSWFFVVFLFLLLMYLLITKLYKSSLSWLCCMMYVVVGFVYVMMLLFQVLLLYVL